MQLLHVEKRKEACVKCSGLGRIVSVTKVRYPKNTSFERITTTDNTQLTGTTSWGIRTNGFQSWPYSDKMESEVTQTSICSYCDGVGHFVYEVIVDAFGNEVIPRVKDTEILGTRPRDEYADWMDTFEKMRVLDDRKQQADWRPSFIQKDYGVRTLNEKLNAIYVCS